MCTDASIKAIGAVPSQADEDGRDHPIHNDSRALSIDSQTIQRSREKHSVLYLL